MKTRKFLPEVRSASTGRAAWRSFAVAMVFSAPCRAANNSQILMWRGSIVAFMCRRLRGNGRMMQDGFGGFHKSSDFHLQKNLFLGPLWLQVLCTTGSLPAAGRRRGRCWGAPAAQQSTALQRRISGNSRWTFLGPLAAFSWARNSIFYLSFLFLFSYLAIAQNLQKRIDSRFVRPWSAFVMSTEKTAPNEIVAGQGLTSRPLNGPASWSVGGPNSWTGSRWSHPALGNEKHLEFTVDDLFESVW